MPIDASIPLQVKQPKLITPGELMSLQDLSTRNQLNQTSLQEKQMDLQNRNSMLDIMRSPGATDPNTGMLTPAGLGQITQINPKMGMELGHQQQQLSLQSMAINEKRDSVKQHYGTAYVTAYQDALARTGGNIQEAENIARQNTLSAIDEADKSGSLRASGFSPDMVQKLRQLPPPEQMRAMITAMGGSVPETPFQKELRAGGMTPGTPGYNKAMQAKIEKDTSPTLQMVMANTTISEEDKKFWADVLRKGGTLPPGLARSGVGAKLVSEVMKEVPKGGTQASDLIANQAELVGLKAGQRTIGTKQAQIEMAVTEAKNMAPLALEASNKVDRTKYPTLNAALLAVEKGTGDENVVRLGVATNSLINIYARAINPTGVATVSDKDHARELLAAAWSKGQYAAGVDQLMKELAAAQKSPPQVRSAMREALTGKKTDEGQAKAPQAAIDYLASHPESKDHFKAKYGYLP